MKNYPKRKPFGSSRKINSGGRGGVADSPYLQANGNSNGFKRNGKNPKDQYNDFLNKAKDAKGQGDEVLEQFYLQHAEHYIVKWNILIEVQFLAKLFQKIEYKQIKIRMLMSQLISKHQQQILMI